MENRDMRERENDLRRQNRKLKAQLEQKSASERDMRDRELSEFKAGISAQFNSQWNEYRGRIEVEKKALVEECEKELVQLKVSPH
jgi:hypothetical protein